MCGNAPEMEPILIIFPPALLSDGRAISPKIAAETALVLRVSSQVCRSVSAPSSPYEQALLTRRSMCPKRATVVSTKCCKSASCLISMAMNTQRSPSASAMACPLSTLRAATITVAPSACNRRVILAPIDAAPPVTTATLLVNLPISDTPGTFPSTSQKCIGT